MRLAMRHKLKALPAPMTAARDMLLVLALQVSPPLMDAKNIMPPLAAQYAKRLILMLATIVMPCKRLTAAFHFGAIVLPNARRLIRTIVAIAMPYPRLTAVNKLTTTANLSARLLIRTTAATEVQLLPIVRRMPLALIFPTALLKFRVGHAILAIKSREALA